jgi:hypothetical protein
MSDLFLSHRIGRQKHLCVSELSRETLAEQGLKGPAFRSGLYLYMLDDRPRVGGISVLAHVPSAEAAFEILDLFQLTLRRHQGTASNSLRKKKGAGGSNKHPEPTKQSSRRKTSRDSEAWL